MKIWIFTNEFKAPKITLQWIQWVIQTLNSLLYSLYTAFIMCKPGSFIGACFNKKVYLKPQLSIVEWQRAYILYWFFLHRQLYTCTTLPLDVYISALGILYLVSCPMFPNHQVQLNTNLCKQHFMSTLHFHLKNL